MTVAPTHAPPAPQRWWGWGADAEAGHGLPDHALALLREELGLGDVARGALARAGARPAVPASGLSASARAALVAAVGEGSVRDDDEARVLHAAGKSLPDLLRLRSADAERAPDAVVAPGDAAQVAAVLAACAREHVAVVPFGGGTSVVGGVDPLAGSQQGVVALALSRLRGVSVDARSLQATVGPGLRLPELEAALQARGVTLGHVPQSYEYATVGGCVATRSSGQASSGFGRIDRNVEGLVLTAPAGAWALPAVPGTAAGPDLRELVVGSEGTLGVLTGITLRVRPTPAAARFDGLAFSSYAEGCEAFRRVAQLHAAPDVARLSDEEETRLSFALSGALSGAQGAALRTYLRVRGVRGGPCVMICGWHGDQDGVRRRRARTMALLRAEGGVPLGGAAGEAWRKNRFHGPYLRDDLLDAGVLVDTLETAATWTGLEPLYRAVRAALREHAPLVMCHVSHLYDTGASLYFTWLARAGGDPLEQWRAAKRAAGEAIVAAGGTITHHHAIGRDHAPWLEPEAGALGLDVLRAAKERLDPAGIMNPGKLADERATLS